MKRFYSIFTASFALLVAAVIGLSGVTTVGAQSSASLSIAPRKDYAVEPGKVINDTLTITNIDREKDLHLYMRVVDFTFHENEDGSSDKDGAPNLLLGEDEQPTAWSLKEYLNVPQNVTIEAGSTKTVNISLEMPKSHTAGSYYSAIVYSSSAPGGGNVGLSASGVTLVFANIPGKVSQKMTLENFGAYSVKDKKFFNWSLDSVQNMGFTLKNEGNVAEAPMGSITLKDIFGRETVISSINPNKQLALIGQTRTFTPCVKLVTQDKEFQGRTSSTVACTEPDLWPGIYTANLSLMYGQNGNETKEINGNTWFVYTPIWFLVLLFIVIALIFFGIYRITRGRHKANRKNKIKSL